MALLSQSMLTRRCVCGRQLTAGRLLDLGVADGSKLTLLPAIEAGLVVSSDAASTTHTVIITSRLPSY